MQNGRKARHSAAYLRELLDRFGNLGLAAAAYNAGPGRVSAWLTNHRALPAETRNYVALVTGWTADEWASSCANLILAPKQERQRIAAYTSRWVIQLAAHLSESTAWAIYRDRLKRFGSLIGDRDPIVLHKEIPRIGRAKRYIITIADDDRAPLDKLCLRPPLPGWTMARSHAVGVFAVISTDALFCSLVRRYPLGWPHVDGWAHPTEPRVRPVLLTSFEHTTRMWRSC